MALVGSASRRRCSAATVRCAVLPSHSSGGPCRCQLPAPLTLLYVRHAPSRCSLPVRSPHPVRHFRRKAEGCVPDRPRRARVESCDRASGPPGNRNRPDDFWERALYDERLDLLRAPRRAEIRRPSGDLGPHSKPALRIRLPGGGERSAGNNSWRRASLSCRRGRIDVAGTTRDPRSPLGNSARQSPGDGRRAVGGTHRFLRRPRHGGNGRKPRGALQAGSRLRRRVRAPVTAAFEGGVG